MPVYQVHYQTTNTYENSVKEALIALLVLPVSDEAQRIISYALENNQGVKHYLQPNLYGFNQIMMRVPKHFKDLEIDFQCILEVDDINPYEYLEKTLEEENEMIHSLSFQIDNQRFLKQSESTKIAKSILPAELIKRADQSCASFLHDLNAYIYRHFTFDDNVDSLANIPEGTLKEQRGVCQDFAQFFVAVCRTNHIPARYVSGYLSQGEGHVGSALMHAWAEALIPGVGWQGYDPTNNLLRDGHYIKVCHGMDYRGCSPIKGVLHTQGKNFTQYKVTVNQQVQQ